METHEKQQVRAPWLKTFFYGELNTYIIPGTDGLTTLGGNKDFESEDLSVCPYQTAAIRDRCEKMLPSLRKAQVVGYKTGLRPHRDGGVRVEAERVRDGPYSATVSLINKLYYVVVSVQYCGG